VGLDLIIYRVGSGLGQVTSGFRSKNVDPCPAHDMVGLGQVWVRSDWPAILCVIFGLDQVFF
jgi:hypothetical protein